jgi:hypothetical protein
VLELAVAVLLLAGLAAAAARLGPPPPLCPSAAWEARSAPAIAALSTDLAAATGGAALPAPTVARLERDVILARGLGVPPGRGPASAWTEALARVSAAASESGTDPARARSELAIAGLELTMARPPAAASTDCARK